MTFETLSSLLFKHNIPLSVKLMSDSRWECHATDMDGVYYNADINTVVFTQRFSEFEDCYVIGKGWVELK